MSNGIEQDERRITRRQLLKELAVGGGEIAVGASGVLPKFFSTAMIEAGGVTTIFSLTKHKTKYLQETDPILFGVGFGIGALLIDEGKEVLEEYNEYKEFKEEFEEYKKTES